MLTGRYKFEPAGWWWRKRLVLHVENCSIMGYGWRPATPADLPALETEVSDGWRFREERQGDFYYTDAYHKVRRGRIT